MSQERFKLDIRCESNMSKYFFNVMRINTKNTQKMSRIIVKVDMVNAKETVEQSEMAKNWLAVLEQ